MIFVFFDDIEGTILGFSTEEEKLDIENNWVTISKEAYDFILENNGQYLINVNLISNKLNEYKNILKKYISNEIEELNYIVVDKSDLYIPDKDLSGVILNRIRKNNLYCKMFIENGITYTFTNGERKQFTFKTEDQNNYIEIRKLIKDGILNNETKIPIKAKDDSEYSFITIEQFTDIHNKLIKNKFYQLFYLRQYNEYTKNLNSINDVHRLQYEMILPDMYQKVIDEQMKSFQYM